MANDFLRDPTDALEVLRNAAFSFPSPFDDVLETKQRRMAALTYAGAGMTSNELRALCAFATHLLARRQREHAAPAVAIPEETAT